MAEKVGLVVEEVTFDTVIKLAMKLNWTRDPFDRIIVATSQMRNCYLITADQTILNNYEKATW